MSGEKFCLKWGNFQSNVSKSFSLLRSEKELSDVTLISDDRKLLTAHKIVLSTCSEYFRDIITQNKLHNPLICLEGVTDADINRVLDYIYYGEIQVFQDYLERFLQLARRFKLDGLTFGNNVAPDSDPPPKPVVVRDEQLGASFLPEFIDGKTVESKCPNKKTRNRNQGEGITDSKDLDWYFLKTRKSSHGPGVLITNSGKYKFYESHNEKYKFYDGKKSFYWTCSEKLKTGCNATVVMKKKTIPGENGEEDKIDYELVKVSAEETHSLYHGPLHHKILAEKIMMKLEMLATDDMFEKINVIEKRVLEEELWSKYPEDEVKLIRAQMPTSITNTLHKMRRNLREKHLKSFSSGLEDEKAGISELDPPIDTTEPLSMKSEHLEESFLPELIDGKIVSRKQEEGIPEPKYLDWYFLKTRKSSHPGILITHSDKYKFYEQRFKETYAGKKSLYWTCSEKKTGCNATAVMKRIIIPGKNGEEDKIDYDLVKVSSEETHSLYHGPLQHKILAEKIMLKAELLATDDIFAKPSSIEKRVLEEELWSKYPENEAKLIRAQMPERIDNIIFKVRRNFREKHQQSYSGGLEQIVSQTNL